LLLKTQTNAPSKNGLTNSWDDGGGSQMISVC